MRYKNPIEDKKMVIDKLKSTSSLNEGLVNDITEVADASKRFYGNLQSLNDTNNDPVDFLVDIIITMLGSEKLEQTVTNTVSKLFKKENKQENGKSLEENLKDMLYKSLKVKNDSTLIPAEFITTGYRVPVKAIDLFDIYKINPTTTTGKLIYGTDINNFNYTFQKNVLMNSSNTNEAKDAGINGVVFKSDNTGLLVDILGKATIPSDTTINTFFHEIIMDEQFKLFDTKKIMTDIVDSIYNFLSKEKTKGSLQMDELIKAMVDNISNEREIDTVFDFNPKMLSEIESNVNKRKNGSYVLDLGCSVSDIQIDLTLINNMLNPETFSNTILNPIAISGNETNNQALKENLHRGILKSLLMVILKNTLFSPRLWTLFIVSSIMKTGYKESIYYKMFTESIPQQQFILSLLKDKNKLIEYVGNELLRALCDYLLTIVIKEVTKLVASTMTEVCKEKVTQIKDLLLSLMNVDTIFKP
jgi:hypothetical protein